MAQPDSRFALLAEWLAAQLNDTSLQIEPASADASFRRYFRVKAGAGSWIAMDAPPPHEDCRPFVAIARILRAAGVNAPHVFAEDLERGFLLLSDLGNTTYLSALDQASAPRLYRDAIGALVKMQTSARADALLPYNRALFQRELDLYPDWYVARHKETSWSDDTRNTWRRGCEVLLENNLAQAALFVHRDYHSRNLMLCDAGREGSNPGVLDFQDAVRGPITYDLVSLFKDAYIQWDEEFVIDQVARYWSEAKRAGLPVDADFGTFYRDFEWMGVQRQLKVLGIFARLCHRDGKAAYLDDMPRVRSGLLAACARYRELGALHQVLCDVEESVARSGFTF